MANRRAQQSKRERGANRSGQNWWVGLNCTHCGKPVLMKDKTGIFTYNQGNPIAEHRHCKNKDPLLDLLPSSHLP